MIPFPRLLILGMCSVAQAADKVTYADNVLPIFRNACANCHNPDKKKAGLDLTTYQATMQGSENGKILNPGNAEASLLLKCVMQTEDPKMPPKGDKLADSEIAIIKNWIAGFALETASSKPAAGGQNKVAAAVVSLERPEGPPPMPGELPLEPIVRTRSTNALVALAASPWAPLVAVGGQRQIVLYNTETLRPLGVLPFPEGFPAVIRFSRNGKLLLTGGGLGGKTGKVVLWDIASGERIGTVGDEVDQVLGADLSPDQQHVALGGPTRVLKIFSTKDGKLEHAIKKHTDWVTAVAFSPDGKYLASADRSGGVVVWEGATGREFNTLAGHKAMVTALAFMPGVLASASEDGKIALWDVKEGKEIRNWAAHAGGVECVDFTPDGRLVSCGRDRVAKAWDQNGKVLATSETFSDIALRAVLNSERVIAGDWTGDIRVFALDGKRLGTLSANPPPLADRLAAARKLAADSQATLPGLKKALADAEEKVKAELAAAQASQKNGQAALAAARGSVEAAEKKLAADRAQLAAAEGAEAQGKLEECKAAVAKSEAECQAAKAAQPAKISAAQKAFEAADGWQALVQGQPGSEPAKRIAQLNTELTKLRAAREGKKEGTPEYKAADDGVQAKKAEIAKVELQLISPAKQELAKANAALEQTTAQAAKAGADIEQWTRAQGFMAVHKARETFAAKKSHFEDLVQTAKDAAMPVDQAHAQIADGEKAAVEAPAKIKAAEAQLAQAIQARDAAHKAAADVQAAAEAKEKAGGETQKIEAEFADLKKKLERLGDEIAKRRAARESKQKDTPEYQQADSAVQAMKPDIAKAEADLTAAKAKLPAQSSQPTAEQVTAAREAAKKAQLDAKLAADKVAAAETALAKSKQESQDAAEFIADLRKKLPALTAAAQSTKAKAESEAVLAVKELESAKTASERARADYDKRWRPATKTASAP